FNGNVSATSNTISSKFKITNTGTSSISLADVTLRYYYTINGEKAQNFFTDWSSVGTGNVIASFKTLSNAKPGADSYAEIGFKSAAGSLEPGQSVELQTRISKEDWSSYTQTDDYSFNPTANSLQDSAKITAYLSGSKQWGIEP
ncbi:xyloglucanase, partial [Paenibacillus sp. OT2-17]